MVSSIDRRCNRRRRAPRACSFTPVLLVVALFLLRDDVDDRRHSSFLVSAQTNDYYCGLNWNHAAETCPHPCPGGTDFECASVLGASSGCFYFTGCWDRVQAGDFGFPPSKAPVAGPEIFYPSFSPTTSPTETLHVAYCGNDWLDASLRCDESTATRLVPAVRPCTVGGDGDCPVEGETCQREVDCQLPIVQLSAEMVAAVDGVTNTMNDENAEVFVSVLTKMLSDKLEDMKINLDSLEMTRQSLGFSFDYVDVTLEITARYRPQSISFSDEDDGDDVPKERHNLNSIVRDYLNEKSSSVALKIKQGAASVQTLYFHGVSGISVGIGRTSRPTLDPTMYPTGKPTTKKPTGVPTPPPTPWPTTKPTEFPSGMPSASPSRSYLQSIASSDASSNTVDTSYGYIFNIRTTPAGPAISLYGMDFYSETTGSINYELWSREGPYNEFRGKYEMWDLIASGTLQGRGKGAVTSIPEDDFEPVTMSGGGETRAFYLTLNTKDLVFQKELSNGALAEEEAADYRAHAVTPELEIYEGEAVMSYPFPDPVSQSFLYRGPQEYVGALHYDRLLCKPFSLYGVIQELPCPIVTASPTGGSTAVPSTSPILAPLSSAPVVSTDTPADEPTSSPVRRPTALPTASHEPTDSLRPTRHPTASPVTSIRVDMVVILHDTPDGETMRGWELDSLRVVLVEFLNGHTGDRLVVDGIDLRDQRLVTWATSGDDREETKPADPTSPQISRGASEEQEHVKKKRLRKEEGTEPVGTNALQLALVLRITYTTLPPEMLGRMAAATMEEHQDELLERVRELGGRYPYFTSITGMDTFHVESIEEFLATGITSPPKAYATVSAESEEEIEDDDKGGPNIGALVGAVVGTFWLCLSAFGLIYLKLARSRMADAKDSEVLSKCQEDPINQDALSVRSQRESSRTIPMGTSGAAWENSDSSWNEETGRTIGLAKAGVSRSLGMQSRALEASQLASRVTAATKLAHSHSDVVTASERESMALDDSTLCRSFSTQQPGKGRCVLTNTTILEAKEKSDGRNLLSNTKMQSGLAAPAKTLNRRPVLCRSDSQIAIDTSAICGSSNQSSSKKKAALKASIRESMLTGWDWDSQMQLAMGSSSSDSSSSQANQRRAPAKARNRRSMLTRSDSRLAIDTSAIVSSSKESSKRKAPTKASIRRPMLSRSDSLIVIDTSLLGNDSSHSNSGFEKAKASLKKSSDIVDRNKGAAKKSFTRSVRLQKNEEAILLDESPIGDPSKQESAPTISRSRPQRRGKKASKTKLDESSGLRRSGKARKGSKKKGKGTKKKNKEGSPLKRSDTKGGSPRRTVRKRASEGDSRQLSLSDTVSGMDDRMAQLGKSGVKGVIEKSTARKRAPSGDNRPLSLSDTTPRSKEGMASLKKLGTTGGSQDKFATYKPISTRKQASDRDNKQLSLSDTTPGSNVGITPLHKSAVMESSDTSQRPEQDNLTSRRRPRNDHCSRLSQSAIVSKGTGNKASLGKTKASADDMQRLVQDAKMQSRKKPSSQKNKSVSRTNSEIASLRKSSRKDSLDDSVASRDIPPSSRKGTSASKTNREMASLRKSPRKDSLDDSVASQDEARVPVRPGGFHDRPAPTRSARRQATMQRLSQSMHVTDNDRYSLNRSATRKNKNVGLFDDSVGNRDEPRALARPESFHDRPAPKQSGTRRAVSQTARRGLSQSMHVTDNDQYSLNRSATRKNVGILDDSVASRDEAHTPATLGSFHDRPAPKRSGTRRAVSQTARRGLSQSMHVTDNDRYSLNRSATRKNKNVGMLDDSVGNRNEPRALTRPESSHDRPAPKRSGTRRAVSQTAGRGLSQSMRVPDSDQHSLNRSGTRKGEMRGSALQRSSTQDNDDLVLDAQLERRRNDDDFTKQRRPPKRSNTTEFSGQKGMMIV